MMVINNNIPALVTYGIVNNTSNALEKSIKKLSTGLRINSAADDAAGLSISEKMRAQINGLDRAVANAQDGVSLIQTAEGALTETHSILQRMRELSVQAANDTLTQQDRSYIQEEVDLLRDEIDHIGNTTTFNTKKLLNGDAAVLWSSDKLSTKAIVNGGLREVDQFGQKKSFEGNYDIKIETSFGQAEVQKSDIMQVKHPRVATGGRYTISTGATTISDADYPDISTMDGVITEIYGENLEHLPNKSSYKLSSAEDLSVAPYNLTGPVKNVTAKKVSNSSSLIANTDLIKSFGSSTNGGSYDFAFEVGEIKDDGTAASAVIHISGFSYNSDDESLVEIKETIIIASQADGTAANTDITVGSTGLVIDGSKTSRSDIITMTQGDKAALNLTGLNDNYIIEFTGSDGNAQTHYFHTYSHLNTSKGVHTTELGFVNLDEDTGGITSSRIYFDFSDDFVGFMAKTGATWYGIFGGDMATIRNYEIGEQAGANVKLYDVKKFWDSQGNFMLEDPQTITITQGDGKTASVTLYGYDTLGDVRDKLNDAIANQLGQAQYIDDSAVTKDKLKGVNHFVDFVDINHTGDTQAEGTDNSVLGTFIIRSAIAGSDGTLRFAAKSEDLINAFSLNTLVSAQESTYDVTITDAHTGESVVETTKITGNKLIGKLHENIDVEFDAMTGVKSVWSDASKKFVASSKAGHTTLHLADNTMTFQIGANEGDDMGINIGDMRSHALGLDSVLVTDRESASRSITIIDSAIDKVSTQRAKLGAYQNRLEHTMTNLETSSENLSAAESRIRDTDMAKEMMNFTKLQIMLQAGNSMLAQANQLPQNVLSLIR